MTPAQAWLDYCRLVYLLRTGAIPLGPRPVPPATR
jgi:hypothetical protein